MNIPKFKENSKSYLLDLSMRGLNKRLNSSVNKIYKERLEREIKVITENNFEDYFLITQNLIANSKKIGISIGPGRGSVVGSLVAYAIGITDVDPIKYNLHFERFLNTERLSIPDIDVDVQSSRRSEIYDYLISKYGKEKVFRMTTKNGERKTLHPSGVLILNDETKFKNKVTKDEIPYQIELNSDQVENLGIPKFDILSSNVMDDISYFNKSFGKANVGDAKTFKGISEGNVLNIFQLDNDNTKKILKKKSISGLEDISELIALNRPMTLKTFLKEGTRPKFLYQEELSEYISSKYKLDMGESELIRIALSKNSTNELNNKKHLINIYNQEKNTLKNTGYLFNKSHSIAYAHIVYELSYYKFNYPKEFISYHLSKIVNSKRKREIANEYKKEGFDVRVPIFEMFDETDDVIRVPLNCYDFITNKDYAKFVESSYRTPEEKMDIMTDIFKKDVLNELKHIGYFKNYEALLEQTLELKDNPYHRFML